MHNGTKQTSKSLPAHVLLLAYRLGLTMIIIFASWSAYTYGFSRLFGTERSYIIPFIIVWAVSAYVVLPRLHRFLTNIYIPNYFIGRTRTSDGFYGDPVNIALNGSEKDLKTAFKRAGWLQAEPLLFSTSVKMVSSSIRKKTYPNAPVSSLFLFGRKQDFTFQQEMNGNPHARHHVRFWKTPDGWYLPGGFKADWIAAGTYDKRVGFSLFTLQITHKIGENTDVERDYIITSLRSVKAINKIDIKKHFTAAFHSRNGGGDRIQTDGSLPFIDL